MLTSSIGSHPRTMSHRSRPLAWNDDLEGETVVWHASTEGLKTVNFLLIALEREETGWDDHAATTNDMYRVLREYAAAIRTMPDSKRC